MTWQRNILIVTLFIAAILRLWNVGSGDTLSDEVLYSFRAVGMLDFDEAAEQTTPLEWFDPYVPSWTRLSFHDHPPFVFAMQHVFMKLFGETPFAFRLPSALLGTASVYILYLIATHLYNRRTGLLAALLFGVTVNHVVISRLGLQESYVIFFILLASYLFLKAGMQNKYYISVGAVLGLALLTKYIVGVLVPIFLTYMLIFRRSDFRSRSLWLGVLISMPLVSPVLLYNIKLYQAVGHFDFQLSFIAGQNPEVWEVQPGKEEFPTLRSRAVSFFPNLFTFNSWVFLTLFLGSSIVFFISLAKNMKDAFKKHAFLLIALFWISFLIIGLIGPSLRFLSILTPFMAVLIAGFLASEGYLPDIQKVTFRSFSITIVIFILLLEITYSINSQILSYPKGPKFWTWSPVRYENYNWGYQELNKWIREKTDGRMPALAFEVKYHFIEIIHKEALAKAERDGKKPYPVLFVYDKNINSIAQLWIMDRLQVYHAWPIITAETYVEFLNEKGADYFKQAGFQEIYYIFPTEKIPWKKAPHLTDIGIKLEQQLTNGGLELYTVLKNKRGDDVFRIYRKEFANDGKTQADVRF